MAIDPDMPVVTRNTAAARHAPSLRPRLACRFAVVVLLAVAALPSLSVRHALAQGDNTQQEQACPGDADDPVATPVEISSVPIMVESTTDEYFVLYVRHDLDADTTVEVPVLVALGEDGTTALGENVEALPAERYRVDKYAVADPADVDGDCIDDITELADPVGMSPVNPAAAIELTNGAAAIPDRATFEALAEYEAYVRFILFGLDTDRPGIYFINTQTHGAHQRFFDAIGLQRSQDMITGRLFFNEHTPPPGRWQPRDLRIQAVPTELLLPLQPCGAFLHCPGGQHGAAR